MKRLYKLVIIAIICFGIISLRFNVEASLKEDVKNGRNSDLTKEEIKNLEILNKGNLELLEQMGGQEKEDAVVLAGSIIAALVVIAGFVVFAYGWTEGYDHGYQDGYQDGHAAP